MSHTPTQEQIIAKLESDLSDALASLSNVKVMYDGLKQANSQQATYIKFLESELMDMTNLASSLGAMQ